MAYFFHDVISSVVFRAKRTGQNFNFSLIDHETTVEYRKRLQYNLSGTFALCSWILSFFIMKSLIQIRLYKIAMLHEES